MRFLSRSRRPSADENEDGWLSDVELDVEGEDATGQEASIGKASSTGKAASMSRLMMKLLKRRQGVDGDDFGLAGDLEEFSDSIATGRGSEVNAVPLLANQISGPSETVSGGPAGAQAAAPPASSPASPTPVDIVENLGGEAEGPTTDRTGSAMPGTAATDTPASESAPAAPQGTTESIASQQAPTRDDRNEPVGADFSFSDIFEEELPENEGLRVLAGSLDDIDATQLAAELRSLVDDLRNR